MNPRILHTLTRLAIDSKGVANGRVRMAAGLFYKKQLIATGVNQLKTHPIMLGEGYRQGQLYMHAEADAIRTALKYISREQLRKCSLHIVRVKRPHIGAKTWIHGLAKPCPGCAQTIANYGITDVHWTMDDQNKEPLYDQNGKRRTKRTDGCKSTAMA